MTVEPVRITFLTANAYTVPLALGSQAVAVPLLASTAAKSLRTVEPLIV